MIGRVVEIGNDRRHLALARGFMTISCDREEIGRIPLDDIGVLLCNAHGLTYSNNLLLELSHRGASVVLCGSNHVPVARIWPLDGHHVQALRMRQQVAAGEPLKKRLWRELVVAKVLQQGAVLTRLGKAGAAFDLLARQVRSGDPDNVEAQAARRYWPLLMGEEFRRDRTAGGANALLNYGYTILRSGVARTVVTAGLHPSIGLHHANRGNPMCLVDDLMEPFRPLVDFLVARLITEGGLSLTPVVKSRLAAILTLDVVTERGTTPVATCLERLAASVASSFELRKARLDLPERLLPLEFPDARQEPAPADE
jgi:CRISPR-associated protein Cas1